MPKDNIHDQANKKAGGKCLRIFNEARKLKRNFTLRNTDITVGEVLDHLQAGYTSEEIRTIFWPYLRKRDVDVCCAIAAHCLEDHEFYRKNHSGKKRAFILLDENQPYIHVPKVLNKISRVGHVSFYGFTQQDDGQIMDFAFTHQAIVITNDDDFLKRIMLEVMQRLYEKGDFDIPIDDIPFIGFVDRSDHQTNLSETALKSRIQNLVKTASLENRQTLWLNIDEDQISQGMTIVEIYHRFVRESLKGAYFSEPLFDKRILDHKMLAEWQIKYGYPHMELTSKMGNLYDVAYAKLNNGQNWRNRLPERAMV